jgi:hypothetical protein
LKEALLKVVDEIGFNDHIRFGHTALVEGSLHCK